MQTTLESTTFVPAAAGQGRRVAGWIITGLVGAFMLLDAGMKLFPPAVVSAAFARTGWPLDLAPTLGVILLVSVALYFVPRTAFLGAVLLTGYLGGAVATNLRLHNPLFSHTLFPVYFGILIWVSVGLRNPKLKTLFD